VNDPGAGEDVTRLTALVTRQRHELDRMSSLAAGRRVVDLARGMLMERLGCSAAQAARQLASLSAESGVSLTELAAQITAEADCGKAPDPWPVRASLASAAMEMAPDATAVAAAMLEEALQPVGASAVAVFLSDADGGMTLAGQAGLGDAEASRWRRIHPDMRTLPQEAALTGMDILWPLGPPPGEDRPLIGRWIGGARAVLALVDAGKPIGAMVVCWPEPLAGFSAALRRQLTGLANLAAQTLGDGGVPAGYGGPWVLGLLAGLLDGLLVARAVRAADGSLTDFVIDYVSAGFADPAGRGPAELTGRHLLEMYPAAALAGGLFDRCAAALEGGEPQQVPGDAMTGAAGEAAGGPVPAVRIARFYDGVAISWRPAGDAERLAALLGHAQRLGRIGGWEENLRTGEVHWTEATYPLFGQPPGVPVPIGELPARVPAEDAPVVSGFLATLLEQGREAAAAFRVIRADDGSVRQMRAYAEPVTGPAGEVTALRGAYQDVSADYHTRLAFAAAQEQLADTEERAREEHRLAVRLQQAITPDAGGLVTTAGLDIAARYRPAGADSLVSGDWYDAVPLPAGDVLLAVGDIAGHGLDAVTGMVALRNSLRGLAITAAAPAMLLGWLNLAACHYADGSIGTAICGRYDPATRTLRWARAGHLPPVLVRDGRAQTLSLPHGLLLGADPDATYAEEVTSLLPGDVLLLFTDGLIERRDEPIDDAIDTLLRIANGRPAGDVGAFADHIVSQSPSDTGDDACLVAVLVR
jgi:Stage II sporulation protein E (SpoIIE)/ANTAR domain/GAF domain